jgi:hypothetical protein
MASQVFRSVLEYDEAAKRLIIAVCDSHNHRVRIIDLLQKKVLKDVGRGEGTRAGQLDFPWGVASRPAVSAEAQARSKVKKFQLFVAERHNNRLQVFHVELSAV